MNCTHQEENYEQNTARWISTESTTASTRYMLVLDTYKARIALHWRRDAFTAQHVAETETMKAMPHAGVAAVKLIVALKVPHSVCSAVMSRSEFTQATR